MVLALQQLVEGPLTQRRLARAVRDLCRKDPHLARVVARSGPPPLWDRAPEFSTLVQIVLEQQVSLGSARAAYARLIAATGAVTPERLSEVGVAGLAAAGLTRQKAAYLHALGVAAVRGELDLAAVARSDDDGVHASLTKLKGIGPWSADIFLLMALGRPDVWPRRDLALAIAMREVKGLRAVPTLERQLEIAEEWRPLRAVAARILWHHYLTTPRRSVAAGRVSPSPRRSI